MAELPRIGVVGATGAVGTVTLELLRAPRLRKRARLRVGAVGRQAARRLDGRRGDARGALARRRRHLPLLRRHECITRARAAGRRGRRGRGRQVSGVPPRTGHPARRARGERAAARSSTTGSSPTRTAARFRSPACSSRSTMRRASHACASRRTSRSPAPARKRWSDSATSRRPSTTCAWTGTSTARSSTRSRSCAPRRRRSWSCPTCRSRRRACACRCMVGHAEAVWIETEDDLTPEQARELLRRRAVGAPRGVPDAGQGRRHRRGARRPHSARPDGRARPRALSRERQPPQGRRAERDPDRRARPAPRARGRVAQPVRIGMLGRFFPGNWRPPADEIRFAAASWIRGCADSERPAGRDRRGAARRPSRRRACVRRGRRRARGRDAATSESTPRRSPTRCGGILAHSLRSAAAACTCIPFPAPGTSTLPSSSAVCRSSSPKRSTSHRRPS